MGLLAAVNTAPLLLFGLLVGVWVNRHRRRTTMIAVDAAGSLLSSLWIVLSPVRGLRQMSG